MGVNARHPKALPGRQTDLCEAQWLATLARAGLLRASSIPCADFGQLRLVARQRQKLVGAASAEKNRPHKVLAFEEIKHDLAIRPICRKTEERIEAHIFVAPRIVNTDQGSQFSSAAFVAAVKVCGAQQSMDGRGCGATTSSSSGCGAA